MRFVQFYYKKNFPKLGIQTKINGDIIDLSAENSIFPNSLMEFLKGGNYSLDQVQKTVEGASNVIPLKEVKLLPPITCPDKIACIGLNYKDHCIENKLPVPKEPIFFSKFSSCIVGPFDNIKYPIASNKLDWEIEMAVVIGKKGYNIPISQSWEHIFGFTIAQDISARDWQKTLNGGQYLLGKSMDTFCPLGPSVVIKESLKNVYNLNLRTKVNGIIKQESNTSELIHKIDYLISRLSRCVTIYPGDVILTGTPAGVGVARNPPEFLKPGDVITSEIDEIGVMQNKIVKII